MRPFAVGLLVAVLMAGCGTFPGGRAPVRSLPAPAQTETPLASEFPLPEPSWPLRLSPVPPSAVGPRPVAWLRPGAPDPASGSSAAGLPLPGVRELPARLTPESRSWSAPAAAKAAPPPVPSGPGSVPSGKTAKAESKPQVPAKPQPAAKATASASPTPAASATLLPQDKAEASDFRWEDVNAVAGDLVTLHFEKTNWLYLDGPAQQKTLGFQSISRDKDATTFQFRPLTPGQYVLEFQRQDLTAQTTDRRKVNLTVAAKGTRTASTSTVLGPQTSAQAANDALESSRQLAAAGKTAEAVQKLLQAYKADDARINLEMARLLNQGGQDDEALTYLDKNLTLTGPDFQGTLELGTRLAASRDPQRKLPPYLKLWLAGTVAPPEELYLQVLETLRSQKMTASIRDWMNRYGGWYPAPKLKDRFLFQVGQILEEPGDARDVRAAWKAYDEVVRLYPLSPFWKAAGDRAAYLNRHFLQVR